MTKLLPDDEDDDWMKKNENNSISSKRSPFPHYFSLRALSDGRKMPDAQLLSKAITEPNAASGLTLAVKIVQSKPHLHLIIPFTGLPERFLTPSIAFVSTEVAENPAEPKYRRVNLGGNAGSKVSLRLFLYNISTIKI